MTLQGTCGAFPFSPHFPPSPRFVPGLARLGDRDDSQFLSSLYFRSFTPSWKFSSLAFLLDIVNVTLTLEVFKKIYLIKKRAPHPSLLWEKSAPRSYLQHPHMKYSSTACSNSLVIIHEGELANKNGLVFYLRNFTHAPSKNKLLLQRQLRNPAWHSVSLNWALLCRSTICTPLCLIF